ncbi:sigma-70 family RNA polymerase sigma factor [bacterium]|nr:sigma-70 family RNA polymerase sigma factor [bacterium]
MTFLSIRAVRDYRQLSDNECMGALGVGDEKGLNEIVRRYQRPLMGYLTRIVNDVERARDLTQETFIRIFRYREAYRTTARFATWLYHIARNVARDELRARRRRIIVAAGNESAEQETVAEPDVLRRLADREVVVRALEQLSARDRALIMLRDVDGLSYDEVAEKVGLPVGTVKSGLSRARRRFRECFGEVA